MKKPRGCAPGADLFLMWRLCRNLCACGLRTHSAAVAVGAVHRGQVAEVARDDTSKQDQSQNPALTNGKLGRGTLRDVSVMKCYQGS